MYVEDFSEGMGDFSLQDNTASHESWLTWPEGEYLEITNGNAVAGDFYDVHAEKDGFKLKSGNSYRLFLSMQASEEGVIKVGFFQKAFPNGRLGLDTETTVHNSGWWDYVFEFSFIDDDCAVPQDAVFYFGVGKLSGTLFVDNIILEELENNAPSNSTTTPDPVSSSASGGSKKEEGGGGGCFISSIF